jgi:methylated-DNA-[protein]-cysteine S-methyltransferase
VIPAIREGRIDVPDQFRIAQAPRARYHGSMDRRYLSTTDSPAGPLHVAVSADGRVTSVWFGVVTDADEAERSVRRHGFSPVWDPAPACHVVVQIGEYSGQRRTSFELELDMQGSDWEKRVWQALLTIPYGETRSYGQIAAMLGDPSKARAVGWANAANPIPVIVPCHRVIGANRNLTGFGGGIDAKIKLLAHEGALLL